jgi:hypothetical protein
LKRTGKIRSMRGISTSANARSFAPRLKQARGSCGHSGSCGYVFSGDD